ncbi:MAG TPA: hypothetical protein DIV86_03175, partial [Alphaproteobacteria bacterium]|nr:hypothetical protein [Alphaproteobacteria bacterium]
RFSIELVKKFEPDNYKNPFSGGSEMIDADYLLMLQVIGGVGQGNKGEQLYEYFTSQLKIFENEIAYASENINNPEDIIKLRHSVSGASTKYAVSLGGAVKHRVTPDLSVSPKNILPFINDVKNYCAANSYEAAIFGHIGIGSFHIHIFSRISLGSKKDDLITNLFDITKKYNGSCWSEHGIGTANAKHYKKYTAPQYIDEWLSYKNKYDPNNILSPRSNGFFC